MKCICCETAEANCSGHVISKFLRDRLTGIVTTSGKKYTFKWQGSKRPTQDLRKYNLMCSACDNGLGATVERSVSSVIMPQNVDDPRAWCRLPILTVKVSDNIAGSPLSVGVYNLAPADEMLLESFTLLTAWRALHAMSLQGDTNVQTFLHSKSGVDLNCKLRTHLHEVHTSNIVSAIPHKAFFYFLGPQSASVITGKNDEMPFSWAFLESPKNKSPLAVVAYLGYWLVILPINAHPITAQIPNNDIVEACFVLWHAQIVHYFRSAT